MSRGTGSHSTTFGAPRPRHAQNAASSSRSRLAGRGDHGALDRGADAAELVVEHRGVAEPLRLGGALAGGGHGPHLAREADLAHGGELVRHGAIAHGARDRDGDREVGRRFDEPHPPTVETYTSCSPSCRSPARRSSTAMIIATRDGSTPLTTRRGCGAFVLDHQRLHLDGQRPPAPRARR